MQSQCNLILQNNFRRKCIVVLTFRSVLIKSKHLQCVNGRHVQVDLIQEELLKDSLKDETVHVTDKSSLSRQFTTNTVIVL